MTTRTLVYEDDDILRYEVFDDDGNRIGEDVEPAHPAVDPANVTVDPGTIEQVKAQLAKATTITGVKNALGPLLDALS